MWLADPATDVATQVQGPWGLLAVLTLVAGGLGGIWLRSKLARAQVRDAPVATAESALAEYKEMTREIVRQYQEDLAAARAECDEERRAKVVAERRQAEAERRAEGLAADVAEANDRLYQCNERLQRAIQARPADD